MARTRQIKPGFFMNEELASVPALGRLLFAGLWTIADREGRLEDRPAKLRAAVLPYDRADGEKLIAQLAEKGFLLRYSVEGKHYLQIVNFAQHQKPHPKEQPSEIPAPLESESHGSTGTSRVNAAPSNGSTGTSPSLPSESSSPSLPSQSDPTDQTSHTTRAKKPPVRVTTVDAEFRAEMVTKYAQQGNSERVNAEIDDALGHTAVQKRTDLKAYVRVWLSRTNWNTPQGRYAGRGAPQPTYASTHGVTPANDPFVALMHGSGSEHLAVCADCRGAA